MPGDERVLYSGNTALEHYEVVDMTYDHRPARVLFSGDRRAAQSGVAHDTKPDLLFDYNQRFLELVAGLYPERILVIGGGAFTLPMALSTALPAVQVDAVEIDAGLVEIAERYFGLQQSERLRIIISEGRAYLDANRKPYDVILIDAFSHTVQPASLTSVEAVAAMERNLTPHGVVAVNIISAYFGRNAAVLQSQYAAYARVFEAVKVYPASHTLLSYWFAQNFMLVAARSAGQEFTVRYDPLPPLSLNGDELLRDEVTPA